MSEGNDQNSPSDNAGPKSVDSSPSIQKTPRWALWLLRPWTVLSCLLLAMTLLAYAFKPDFAKAITVFPFWCWAIGGACLLLPEALFFRRRLLMVVLGIWLVATLFQFDSATSLVRGVVVTPGKKSEDAIRVISINSTSNINAVRDVKRFQPDILLIQESSWIRDLEEAALEIMGEEATVFWSIDCSMIARGTIDEIEWKPHFATGRVHLKNHEPILVSCLRLETPPFRLDLWDIDCWTDFARNRGRQRNELKQVLESIQNVDEQAPMLIGGDFNAPPHDAIFDVLRDDFHDAFREAGFGWGATITNDYPLIRIDQLWCSRHWKAEFVVAVPSNFSDHRMIICDIKPVN